MKVSIIIPVHNVEQYIERCIVSVMRQSFTDIECIIVDDCSTDSSIDICRKLIESYQGSIAFSILSHETAEGPSGTRNDGTNVAIGDFIFYLDSDDEITDDCISLLYAKTIEYPDVEIVQGLAWAEKNRDYYSLNRYQGIDYVDDNNWIQEQAFKIEKSLPVDVWNKLIRKEFLEQNHIRFTDGIIHEDQLWSYQVFRVLKALCFVHQETYYHYSVPNSVMTSLSKQVSDESWMVILENIVPNINPPCMELQLRRYLYEYMLRFGDNPAQSNAKRLLKIFARKSWNSRAYHLAFALVIYYKTMGKSLKQWILTYCRNICSKGLNKEILSDIRAWCSIKIK